MCACMARVRVHKRAIARPATTTTGQQRTRSERCAHAHASIRTRARQWHATTTRRGTMAAGDGNWLNDGAAVASLRRWPEMRQRSVPLSERHPRSRDSTRRDSTRRDSTPSFRRRRHRHTDGFVPGRRRPSCPASPLSARRCLSRSHCPDADVVNVV